MANEKDDGRKYDALLKTLLGDQERMRKDFEQAVDSNYVKGDIDLGEESSKVTDIRQNRIDFLVQHTPSTLINSWSAFTGPRALKTGIEKWVTDLDNDKDLQKLLEGKDTVTDKFLAIQELYNKWVEQDKQ